MPASISALPPVSREPPSLPSPLAPRLGMPGTVQRLLVVGGLILALLIPLAMVDGVLRERKSRRNEAIREITASWGLDQILTGPVLIVPYRYTVEKREKVVVNAVTGATELRTVRDTFTAPAYFLPERMTASGRLAPQKRKYGIYEAVLFQGTMDLAGDFTPPDFGTWKVDPQEVDWKDALLAFHVSDLRGAPEALTVTWDGREVPLEPGSRLPGYEGGIFARIPMDQAPAGKMPFALQLALNGSHSMQFAPVGRQTTVRLESSWPDPKFQGAFLPLERSVSPDGFDATWSMSYYGRTFPQQWTGRDGSNPFEPQRIRASLFGVSLLSPVDHYRLVERSIKYGILFLVLVFTVFFLFEVRSGVRVHPVQYLLVGAALVLFFLLLLALSEMFAFGLAYAAGAAACTLLITCYSARALGGAGRALTVAAQLAVIYGLLYVILRQQDYALLLGSCGLFVMLAMVMYATRDVR